MIPQETGVFFRYPTPESLMAAIEVFEARSWDPRRCRANAARFATGRFLREMVAEVDAAVVAKAARRRGGLDAWPPPAATNARDPVMPTTPRTRMGPSGPRDLGRGFWSDQPVCGRIWLNEVLARPGDSLTCFTPSFVLVVHVLTIFLWPSRI